MPDKKMKYGKDNTIQFDKGRPFVIICEGEDDSHFLREYLCHIAKGAQIDEAKYNIIPVGGVDNIRKNMNILKQLPRYDEMKGFLFVRDADRNANSAVDSLVDHIYRNWNIKLSKDGTIKQDADGVKIGFFIFPGQGIDGHFLDGALEDFCLDLFHDDEEGLDSPSLKSLVDSFIERLRAKRGKRFKTEHKNHLFLLLSSTDKAVGRKIGEAAKTGVFDFKNAKLEPLKKLILQMND